MTLSPAMHVVVFMGERRITHLVRLFEQSQWGAGSRRRKGKRLEYGWLYGFCKQTLTTGRPLFPASSSPPPPSFLFQCARSRLLRFLIQGGSHKTKDYSALAPQKVHLHCRLMTLSRSLPLETTFQVCTWERSWGWGEGWGSWISGVYVMSF